MEYIGLELKYKKGKIRKIKIFLFFFEHKLNKKISLIF